MRFSIIMPTCNRPKFLRRAVEAIYTQHYTDWELIIKDASDVRIGADLPADSRIIYVHGKDRGITHAVNQACALATGEVMHWANDDDVMEPGALAHVASTLGDAKWMYARAEVTDLKGNAQFLIGGEPWSMSKQLVRNLCPQPTVYWRRDLLELVGPFDEDTELASDYDMWTRFGYVVDPLVQDVTLARYTLHDGSISVKRIDDQNADADKVRLKHLNSGREVRS